MKRGCITIMAFCSALLIGGWSFDTRADTSSSNEKETASRSASCWEKETPGATCKEDRTGMEFVYVPGGCFQMGQTEEEKAQLIKEVGEETYKSWYANELPRHEVCVHKGNGFWIGKYEVTQAQWETVMKYNLSNFKGANRPVEKVSWDDAQEFLQKLNTSSSPQFRLPSEAEWEYAARAGTTTPFSFGETISTDQANYNGNDAYSSPERS